LNGSVCASIDASLGAHGSLHKLKQRERSTRALRRARPARFSLFELGRSDGQNEHLGDVVDLKTTAKDRMDSSTSPNGLQNSLAPVKVPKSLFAIITAERPFLLHDLS
jgi:hypothetical protein